MRLYRRSNTDMINHLKRCNFEAQRGWVSRALERVQDIAEEFPNDADVIHIKAALLKEYLGRGLEVRELCESAYELDSTEVHANNAAMLARSAEEFSKWTDLAIKAAPRDAALRRYQAEGEAGLKTGTPYWQMVTAAAESCRVAKNFGLAAAALEVALYGGGMRPAEELNLRRVRAECLRALDIAASQQRETRMEAFIPEERLALVEALAELNRALAIDEFDAELWNLKSAWSALLERFEDAILCADRALVLRPHHYPKPYVNKAKALRALKRSDEALACARESLKQAEGGEPNDGAVAREIIELYGTPQKSLTLADLKPLIKHIRKSAWVTVDQELGQQGDSIVRLTKGFGIRATKVGSVRTMDYVPLMAEVLSDFTPEVVLAIMDKASHHGSLVGEHCLYAALYVAAHSEGVLRHDAARFIALSILSAPDENAIRRSYREAILETTAAAADEMAQLDEIVREELRHINPLLPELIANQDRVGEESREKTAKNMIARFGGGPPKRGPDDSLDPGSLSRHGPGCGLVVVALVILVNGLRYFVW